MAITFSAVYTAGTGTDATSFVTPNITSLSAGDVVIMGIINTKAATPDAPTITANGLTWLELGTGQEYATSRRMSIWLGYAGTPVIGAGLADYGIATQTGFVAHALVFSGTVNTNVSAINIVTGSESAQTTHDAITLAAFSDAANATVSFWALGNNTGVFTEGAGFTAAAQTGLSTEGCRLFSQYQLANDTTPTATTSTSQSSVGKAFELVADAATGQPTARRFGLSSIGRSGVAIGKARMERSGTIFALGAPVGFERRKSGLYVRKAA